MRIDRVCVLVFFLYTWFDIMLLTYLDFRNKTQRRLRGGIALLDK
jgi:hypothetical protein